MVLRPKDPLLTAARLVIGFLMIVLGIGIAAIAIAIPALLLNQEKVLAEFAEKGAAVGPEIFGAIVIAMLCLAGFLALAIWFLALLRTIVNTVAEGDPFVPDNARRLARMGWIVVGTQVVTIPAMAMLLWIAEALKEAEGYHIDADGGVSGGAIVLILVLFILARVFRHGAAMREDLEGTV
jgi:hypothetical protein